MSRHTEKAMALRAVKEPHYNCAQSVLLAFSEEIGVPEDVLYKTAANFGKGMKTEGVCGAVTGGLMALGLLGIKDPESVIGFQKRMGEMHDGMTDCAELTRHAAASGIERSDCCNKLVADAVELVETYLDR